MAVAHRLIEGFVTAPLGHQAADMLQAYVRKFSVGDTARVLYSLSYFDDAEP